MQLSVGSHEFIGEGRTRQAARHSAAMKALQALRNEPIPERPPQVNTQTWTHVLDKYWLGILVLSTLCTVRLEPDALQFPSQVHTD